jgi:signal transduction histidine kinase
MVYAGLFLASGAVLLAITYVLVRQATGDVLFATRADGSSFFLAQKKPTLPTPGTAGGVVLGARVGGVSLVPPLTPAQMRAQIAGDMAVARRQHEAELNSLIEQSGIALGIMAAISILLGWLAAGRVLRPLRTLNERTREISATSLHKRLALDGPADELKQLADTFDDLLSRLEASFAAQRQFVANASHELRTPLARAQTLAEVALEDPAPSIESLRASHLRVLAAGKQQERLIEALLTLARSERGLEQRERFDLAEITRRVIAARRPDAEERRVYVYATLHHAETTGAPHLAERLVANLVDNALRHNLAAGGRIDVVTADRGGRPTLWVTNSGPSVPDDQVERLFQPFQRLGAERTDHSDGVGLGLSIVQAIAVAHEATIEARAQAEGGLDVEVAFAPPLAPDGPATEVRRRRARGGRASQGGAAATCRPAG